MTLVDTETRRILEEAVSSAENILEKHRSDLQHLADLLCEHEAVDGAEIEAILGKTAEYELER